MHARFFGLAMWMVMCGLLVGGCGRAPEASGDGGRAYPYKVVTTVGMVTDIVQAVAGDKAQVRGIIGQGVDPHLYKATRDDISAMMGADVVFYSGLLLEGKMTDSLVRVARNKAVCAVTEKIAPEYLLEPAGMAGHADPHVWMDVSAWSQAVQAVADELTAFDPANADYYKQNAQAYQKQLTELDAYGKRVMATIPEPRRVLITSHDAFNYFGRAYGIKVMGVQGVSTESEAALSHINELVDYIVSHKVQAIFIETTVNPKNIRAIIEGAKGRGYDLKIGGELFSDAMGKPGTYEGTYVGMLDHNLTTVVHALGGEAPAGGFQGKLSHE